MNELRKPYLTPENRAVKTAEWSSELKPFSKRTKDFEFHSSALLVIDMQQCFLDKNSHAYAAPGEVVEENVHQLIETFHEQKRPVIFTYFAVQEGEPDPLANWWYGNSVQDGTKESELSPKLPRNKNDFVLRKNSYSTFHAPEAENLKILLKEHNVKNIVIAGVLTNLCCETAAREAFEQNLNVFVPMDGTATQSEELHLASLKNMAYGFATILTTKNILK